MTTLTLIAGGWFLAYVLIIKKLYGKLTSISASTYELAKEKTRHLKWVFWGWLVVLGVLLFLLVPPTWGFGLLVGLIFTGITVDHAGSFPAENLLHTICAIGTIATGALMMYFEYSMVFPAFVILLGILTLKNNKTFIWDIEVIAYYTLLFSLLLR